jgi:hypothetical protein
LASRGGAVFSTVCAKTAQICAVFEKETLKLNNLQRKNRAGCAVFGSGRSPSSIRTIARAGLESEITKAALPAQVTDRK